MEMGKFASAQQQVAKAERAPAEIQCERKNEVEMEFLDHGSRIVRPQ